MDPKDYNRYVMSFHWFKDIQKELDELFGPAADFLGHMMTKDLDFPFRHVKASPMQAMGVLAWLHERGLTVEELYENPKFFQELRTAMVVHALGIFPANDAGSNQKLIALAVVSEQILKGHKEERPWEAIEANMTADPVAA